MDMQVTGDGQVGPITKWLDEAFGTGWRTVQWGADKPAESGGIEMEMEAG